MSDDKPVDNLIQDEEAAQLKAQAESLISEFRMAVYDAQDAVLDDLNHGLPAQEIWSSFLRHAEAPVARILNRAGFVFVEPEELTAGNDRIAGLYTRLGNELDRLLQSPDDPELQLSTERIWHELRTLQEEEAAQIKNHYRKSLELPLGRAKVILDHIQQLKKKYANPSETDATAEGAN